MYKAILTPNLSKWLHWEVREQGEGSSDDNKLPQCNWSTVTRETKLNSLVKYIHNLSDQVTCMPTSISKKIFPRENSEVSKQERSPMQTTEWTEPENVTWTMHVRLACLTKQSGIVLISSVFTRYMYLF